MKNKITVENLKEFGMIEPEGIEKHIYPFSKTLIEHEDGNLDLVVTMERNTPMFALKMPGNTIMLSIQDMSDLRKLERLIIGFDTDY